MLIFRKSDAQFEIKKFEQLISSLQLAMKLKGSSVTDIIQKITNDFKGDSSFTDMLVEAQTIFKELSRTSLHTSNTMKVKILIAELSLLTSLLFIRMMAEMKPVDHVEKYRLKVKYIEEDIEMFEVLLSTYYIHGVVSGSIVENRDVKAPSDVKVESLNENREILKKIHPYCGVLFKLKQSTADKVQKYASGNTFRPETPTYSSFVKVSILLIRLIFDKNTSCKS